MKPISYIVPFLLVAFLIPFASGDHHSVDTPASNPREIQVKAGLVYRLASFAKWPKECFDKKDDPIRLTIFGNPALYEKYANGRKRKIGKRTLEVTYADSPANTVDSHILFIDARHAETYFAEFKEIPSGVLTIGDSDKFAENNGIIQISIKNDKSRLKVNMTASKEAGIRIDAQVLENSEIYREPSK
jgi:hypothetical protein